MSQRIATLEEGCESASSSEDDGGGPRGAQGGFAEYEDDSALEELAGRDADHTSSHKLGFRKRVVAAWVLVAAMLGALLFLGARRAVKPLPLQLANGSATTGLALRAPAAAVMSAAPIATVPAGALPPAAPAMAPAQLPVAESPAAPTLYCYMVILPFGHERELTSLQYVKTWSVFGCDAHSIFSNTSFELAPGGERTISFGGNMLVDFNTWTWAKYDVRLALNTGVFLRAWKKMIEVGIWRNHDWTVKCEADTVFFPSRLVGLLRAEPLVSAAPAAATGLSGCGNCSLPGMEAQSCASHVHWLQGQGNSCAAALERVARPNDCQCDCAPDHCVKPMSVYLRNCAYNFYTPDQKEKNKALHGPLEVLSKAAWVDLAHGLDDCASAFSGSFEQWGEDWFLEHCLLHLGVNPLDSFRSLNDLDCNPYHVLDNTCTSASSAFQPYKEVWSYRRCVENAESRGSHWPPSDLRTS
eukprot:TRINITY_DN30918_c0_g1_i1.p1 TRINITY_DN30918_c0_g1~~TRINITY_DN30918_c0_g1_i1.p1  ORF type:complete len:470 (-),score=103.89 TRINITY_DN30918_c0_g1_i1:42-1451(-)